MNFRPKTCRCTRCPRIIERWSQRNPLCDECREATAQERRRQARAKFERKQRKEQGR